MTGPAPFAPSSDAARAFLFWAFWSSAAFFAVYPVTNWLASKRKDALDLHVSPELGIPFVPELIWAYFSMYVLFVVPLFVLPANRMPQLGKQLVAGALLSGLAFVLIPAKLGFERVLPEDPFYADLYAAMFRIDHPYNLVPSLHLVYSGAIVLACADAVSRRGRALLFLWLAAITASTLLVHQHHLLDVVAAFALVFLLTRTIGRNYA